MINGTTYAEITQVCTNDSIAFKTRSELSTYKALFILKIKEGMKAVGLPDDNISSQCYDYQKEGYNWLIAGSPAHACPIQQGEHV